MFRVEVRHSNQKLQPEDMLFLLFYASQDEPKQDVTYTGLGLAASGVGPGQAQNLGKTNYLATTLCCCGGPSCCATNVHISTLCILARRRPKPVLLSDWPDLWPPTDLISTEFPSLQHRQQTKA